MSKFKGKTLAELNVKEGDVVEWIGFESVGHHRLDFIENNTSYVFDTPNGPFTHDLGCEDTFRIISRASDESNWTLCPPDYEEQTNHECTYHMGIPVAYREISVTRDETWSVHFNGKYHDIKGQTRDGVPVGEWFIDMDETE